MQNEIDGSESSLCHVLLHVSRQVEVQCDYQQNLSQLCLSIDYRGLTLIRNYKYISVPLYTLPLF